jgi:hypothetical protein
MDELIDRRTLRRMIFTVREGRIETLDRDERQLAEEVRQEFDGYLLGSIGWSDFTTKWDIGPGRPEEAHMASRKKLLIADWGGEIINLWEWKQYVKEFIDLYGKTASPPPCFTRQGRLDNGSQSNL